MDSNSKIKPYFFQETERINQFIDDFIGLCNKYGFKGKVSKTADLKLYAPTTDIFKTKWLDYKYETDTLTIVGDTDGLKINLNETCPDLSRNDILSLVEDLNKLFDCDLQVNDLIGKDDWQRICDNTDYKYRHIEGLLKLQNKQDEVKTSRPGKSEEKQKNGEVL